MNLKTLIFFNHFVLYFILIGIYCPASVGQSTNPFEIKKSVISVDSQLVIKKDTSSQNQINPFVLRKPINNLSFGEKGQSSGQILQWINAPVKAKMSYTEIQSILFWALLFLNFLLAIALNINRSVTLKLYRSIININFLSLLYRDSKEENLLIYYLLYGLYFIGLSLFIYLGIIHFKGVKEPIYILYIATCILFVYTIRHMSLKIVGKIYGFYLEADRYLFSIVIFSCILSILLIPADFIITFANPEIGKKSILLICFLALVLYLFRQFREILFSVNLWRNHLFHFLLYLCTFEIAPLVLFIVFLKKQGVI